MRTLIVLLSLLFVAGAFAQKGWYPHEGSVLKYRVNIRFGQEPETMPKGWYFGRVSAVATDSQGDVYVFHRGTAAPPIVVFDKDGKYLRSWGKGEIGNAHGIEVDADDNVWTIDNGHHTVQKWTREGKLLQTLGTKGKSGETENTFYRPTDIAFAKDGSFYVSDGYGNSRVVKFTKEGKFILAWGKKGKGPGEFNLPHNVALDSKGTVYVSDRENNRIQIFDPNGKFLKMWTHLGATQGVWITPEDELWVVTHRNHIQNVTYDTLAGLILKIDLETGEILGSAPSPGHWITVAKNGEIFIGSLTGNVFRWYEGWMDRGLFDDDLVNEGQTPANQRP